MCLEYVFHLFVKNTGKISRGKSETSSTSQIIWNKSELDKGEMLTSNSGIIILNFLIIE